MKSLLLFRDKHFSRGKDSQEVLSGMERLHMFSFVLGFSPNTYKSHHLCTRVPGDFISSDSFPSTSTSYKCSLTPCKPRLCPNLKYRRQQHTMAYYHTEHSTWSHISLTELTNLHTFPQATHPSSPKPQPHSFPAELLPWFEDIYYSIKSDKFFSF